MNTTEKNKLIAEFMGANLYAPNDYEMYGIIPCIEDGAKEQHFFTPDQMKFDSSWDWLMPVVEKIEGLKLGDVVIKTLFDDEDLYKDANVYFRIEHSNAYIDLCGTMKLYESIIDVEKEPTKIKATYKAVVEFIKWYNELK